MSSKHDPVARADRDNRTEPTEQLHTCVRSTSDVQGTYIHVIGA